MARGDRRDLFLSIGGSVTGLQAASKAGRTALLELGSAADDIQAEVTKAFENMGANAPAAAKQLEQAYNKTFAAIRRNAEAALSAPNSGAALQIIDSAAAEQAAQKAEQLAVQLRVEATAAAAVAQRVGDASAAHQVLAHAMEANAQVAENEAIALRNQANVIGDVRAELGLMGEAQRRAVSVSGQQRNSLVMVGQQLQDFSVQVGSGQSVATAFAQQIGQLAFAVQGLGGRFEALGTFLTSGLGIGVTLALTIIAPLVAKLFEGGKAADEFASKSMTLSDALSRQKFGTEDALKALRDYNAEQDKAADKDSLATDRQLNLAKARLQEALATREQLSARLAAVAGDGNPDDPLDQQRAGAQSYYSSKLKENEALIAETQQTIRNLDVDAARSAAAAAADPIEAIRQKYKRLSDAASEAARNNDKLAASLSATLSKYAIEEKAAIDAEQKRESAARSTNDPNRQLGRDITLTDAEAIVAGIGGRVTSARRSTAKQAELYARYEAGEGPLAAKPGTSYHERGQALDIAKTGGITLGAIAKAFADQGVRLVEKLDEGDHYHVAWKNSGPSADQIAKRNEAAAEKQARDAEAYGQLLNRAQQEHIDLTRRQVTDVAQAADLDAQGVELERQRLDVAAQAGVSQHRWTQAQADAVKAVNKQNAELRVSAIRQQEGVELLDQQIEDDRQRLTYSASLLQLQGDLATSNEARKKIALQLLANEEQMQRDQAKRLLGSNDPRDWQKGEDLLRQIDAEHPYKTEEVNRRFADPLGRYRDQLQESVGNWNTALQGVKVDGLQSIEDGLLGIINGTESVSSAFKKMASSIISDIARIIIERTILSAIDGGSLFGLHLATGGKIEGKATGGIIRGPGTGTSDSILALIDGSKPLMVSNGESIVTAEATQRYWPLIDAMNKGKLPHFATGGMIGVPRSLAYPRLPSSAALAQGGYGGQRLQLDARVQVDASPMLEARMQDISVQTVGAAAEPIMAGAQSRTIRRLARHSLPGGLG